MDNSFIALGLMSGTSLDGIDASIIKSDGKDNLEIIDMKRLIMKIIFGLIIPIIREKSK